MRRKKDISVVCCWWGNWPTGESQVGIMYVNKLFRMVNQYLTFPHRFICFTDHMDYADFFEPGIELQELQIPKSIEKFYGLYFYQKEKKEREPILGHFPKLNFYRPDNGLTGRVFAMDLDVILTGNIDAFVDRTEPFIIRKTFGKLRKQRKVSNRIGGGLVSFDGGAYDHLWEDWMEDNDRELLEKFQGDERRFYAHNIPEKELYFWQDLLPGQLVRFRRVKKLPSPRKRMKIIAITGNPFLHQIDRPIVKEYWDAV